MTTHESLTALVCLCLFLVPASAVFGAETVIYDNDMDQPIGGGNIVGHTK